MYLWETVFRTRLSGVYQELSTRFPETQYIMWYVWNRQILKFNPASDDEFEDTMDYLEDHRMHIEKSIRFQDGYFLLISEDNEEDFDVWRIADANHCIELPPAIFHDGEGEYRIAGFDEDSISSLISDMKRFAGVRLKVKRKLPINILRSSIWMSSIFSLLTEKQSRCLIEADIKGYYRIPRTVKTSEIASSMGISRSTFEAHLRKAENSVIESIVPYLQLFTSTEGNNFHHQTIDAPQIYRGEK